MRKCLLYIASRSAHANAVKEIWKEVESYYYPAFDWTGNHVTKPELNVQNTQHAISCIEACQKADVFVMLDQGLFHGAFGAIVEFGAAVSRGIPCFIVAPLTRQSIFMTLPNVKIVESVESVCTLLIVYARSLE